MILREVYLMIIFLGNLLSSFVCFKQGRFAQGMMDSLIFSIAILLFMNKESHGGWFIGTTAVLYGLGALASFKVTPIWASLYRVILCIFGFYLILA